MIYVVYYDHSNVDYELVADCSTIVDTRIFLKAQKQNIKRLGEG